MLQRNLGKSFLQELLSSRDHSVFPGTAVVFKSCIFGFCFCYFLKHWIYLLDLAVSAELVLPTTFYDTLGNPFYEACNAMRFYAETNYPDVLAVNKTAYGKGNVGVKVIRDPRFESLCGTLDPDGFRNRYNFLYEKDLPAEILSITSQALKKEMRKSKDPEQKNEIEERISWVDKQLKSDSTKNVETSILAKHKKKEREAAKQGKRPFYLKKSEIRKQRLIEKYEDLKTTGKLDSYIEKKRKRNASKDHRLMPYRRSGDNVE